MYVVLAFLATIYILIIMDGEWLPGDRVVDTADWWDYTPESYSGHDAELWVWPVNHTGSRFKTSTM